MYFSLTEDKEEKETKGVPGFWLTIFKNVDMLSEMIQVLLSFKTFRYFIHIT